MSNFILKNALTKKSKLLLTSLTIIIACVVGLLSINISQQVNEGIIELSDGYDVVIGPAGSESQLAFNALFFSEDPLGTVDYSVYENLQSDTRINKVIPVAMADSYGNYRIVGTSEEFLVNYKINGKNFGKEYECVIGKTVAQKTGLSVGDTFFSTHGAMGTQHSQPLIVVGIMDKTNTNYDNTIFTHVETVWGLHGSSHNHN
jgi:putative ABC transport system permease protein